MKIAICIPMTSKKQDWKNIWDCDFLKIFLPSFLKTKNDEYDYHFYIGIDENDDFFNKYLEDLKIRLNKNCKIYVQNNYSGNPCGYWNYLFYNAFLDNCEYFCQFGDDINILSYGWTSYFINILKNNNNYGVCGGCDLKFWVERLCNNSIGILENIFFHKNHFQFQKYIFPKELKTWWSDDYISNLYYNLSFCCPEIQFKNMNRVGGHNEKSRYEHDPEDSNKWKPLVERDQKKIIKIINEKKLKINFKKNI